MGLSVGSNWWDNLQMGVGQLSDPYGSLSPGNSAGAFNNSMISLGTGMLADSRKRPMEAFGSAWKSAQQEGQQNSINKLNAQNLMLGMDKTKKDMAWQGTERQNELEDRGEKEENKRRAAAFVEEALKQPRADIPMENYGKARFWMAAGDPEKAYEALTGDVDDGSEYGTTAIYGKDAQGNTVVGQMNKAGGFRQAQLPQGFKLTPGVEKVDLGTAWGILNRDGDVVGTVPKDLAGAESEKERGQQEGKQAAAAPADMQAAEEALRLVEELKVDPNRERGTGATGYMGNWIPSTRGYDYQNKVDQAKSGAFLTAVQQMRGLGQMSNIEGQTATQAITRMNTATSEGAFLSALEDYERVVRKAYDRAAGRIGAPPLPDQTGDEGGWTTLPNGVRIRQKGP